MLLAPRGSSPNPVEEAARGAAAEAMCASVGWTHVDAHLTQQRSAALSKLVSALPGDVAEIAKAQAACRFIDEFRVIVRTWIELGCKARIALNQPETR